MSGVTITTYTMIAFSGKRSEESARVMDQIRSREWGLLLMDEVHVVPAQMFRKVCLRCPALASAFIKTRDLPCQHMLSANFYAEAVLQS